MTQRGQRLLTANSKTREAVDMMVAHGEMSQIQFTRALIALCDDKAKAGFLRNHLMKSGYIEKRVTLHVTDLARNVDRKGEK